MQDCKAECQNSHVMQHLEILIYNMPKCPKEEYAGSQVSWLSMDGWMSSLFQVIEQQQQKKKGEELKTKQRYIFSVHLKVYRII